MPSTQEVFMRMNKWIISWMLIGVMVSAAASAEELQGAGNLWAPWTMQDADGNALGISVDVFKDICQKTGMQCSVSIYPHKRRDKLFAEQRIDAELGVAPDWRGYQQEISVYTIPFVETRNIVLMKKSRAIQATSIEDFQGMRIGTNLGYYYTDGFQQAFERQDIFRDDTGEGSQLMQKLAYGRVDGIILDQQEALYWIKELGFSPEDYTAAYTFQTISKLAFRFHVSKKAVIPQFNQAIRAMQQANEIHTIIEKYTQ
jgi:ABC-type amino acid transport substrate-binding protein